MHISKAKSGFFHRLYEDPEITYKWESSIPDVYKKINKNNLRNISAQPQKNPSLEYLKSSDKILEQYSKASGKPSLKEKRSELSRKYSILLELDHRNLSSFGSISKLEFLSDLKEASSQNSMQNSKKAHEFKTFSFDIPGNSEEYLVNQYLRPHKLIRVKHYLKNQTKPLFNQTTQISNPNLKDERKGLVGKKFIALQAKNKKLLLLANNKLYKY